MNMYKAGNIDPHEDLQYLSMTDKAYGEAKGRVGALEQKMKVIEAVAYLRSDEKTQEAKKADARSSAEYRRVSKEYEDAVMDMNIIGTERRTRELRIEVWRTESANSRQGNI